MCVASRIDLIYLPLLYNYYLMQCSYRFIKHLKSKFEQMVFDYIIIVINDIEKVFPDQQ